MPTPALTLSAADARRFMRRAVLLDSPAPSVGVVLDHHGFVQIDPINVCGRMHDLILRNRVAGYREGDLMRHLHGGDGELDSAAPAANASAPARTKPPAERTAFEHHLPDTNVLVAFPLDAWPHLLAAMHRRSGSRGAWSGRLTPRERSLADHILAEIAARGPLSSDDIDDSRRARRVWGAATLAKSTLQKLFFHGRVLIARRAGQRRIYDLPERVLPPSALAAPVPPAADTARWLAILKLRQRRLVTLKRDELPLVADFVQPISVADCPPLFCLRTDLPLLDTAPSSAASSSTSTSPFNSAPVGAAAPRLLAPLDPLIYDRRVTAALWNFDYTWEVYTPPSKRVRGYYALPVLAGDELVGHVDPKADRLHRKLLVVSRSVRRGHAVAPAVDALAAFLGLRR